MLPERSIFKSLNGRRLWTPVEKEFIASELARGQTRRQIHDIGIAWFILNSVLIQG